MHDNSDGLDIPEFLRRKGTKKAVHFVATKRVLISPHEAMALAAKDHHEKSEFAMEFEHQQAEKRKAYQEKRKGIVADRKESKAGRVWNVHKARWEDAPHKVLPTGMTVEFEPKKKRQAVVKRGHRPKAKMLPVATAIATKPDGKQVSGIKALRVKAGLSQGEVAAKLGMTRSHYSNLENGHRLATAEQLKIIEGLYA